MSRLPEAVGGVESSARMCWAGGRAGWLSAGPAESDCHLRGFPGASSESMRGGVAAAAAAADPSPAILPPFPGSAADSTALIADSGLKPAQLHFNSDKALWPGVC